MSYVYRLGVSSLLCLVALPACSDPASPGETAVPSGSEAGEETTDETGAATSDGSGTTGAATTTTTTTTTDDPTGEPPTTSEGTTGEPPPSPWDGEPLPDAPPGEWTWVGFPDAHCRDGSETGIGVRYGTGDGLVIYFQGGGACFNALTCANNPDHHDEGNFPGPDGGIFDGDAATNPVGDWSFIFVPYCTGDVHSGTRPDTSVPGGPMNQRFVGYLNVEAYLERVVPTFSGVSHVLVTGESAGGFGAAFNYDRIADAFPGTKVTLLDDSGPPLGDEVLAPCLQSLWRELWGYGDVLPADCAECFHPDGGGIIEFARYIGQKHAAQRLALISSTGDEVIRLFFGFGEDECTALLKSTPQDAFESALVAARDGAFSEPQGTWGSFLVDNTGQHTFLSGSFYTAEVAGVKLADWVRDLLNGDARHLGP
jgi:hypothetical protein